MMKDIYHNHKGETIKRILYGTLIIGAMAAIGLYIAGNLEKVITGPHIQITSPTDRILSDSAIELQGQAFDTKVLTVNGSNVTLDPAGNFLTRLLVPPGRSIITLRAQDRFERISERTISLYAIYQHESLRTLETPRRIIQQPEQTTNVLIEEPSFDDTDVPDAPEPEPIETDPLIETQEPELQANL